MVQQKNSMKEKLFVANKAVIVNEKNEILLIQENPDDPIRSHPKKWDVVGGRMDMWETPQESLLREIHEEVGIDVEIGRPIYVADWRPSPVPDEKWQIIGIFYYARAKSTDITLSGEHMNYAWVALDTIDEYNIIDQAKQAILKIKHPD